MRNIILGAMIALTACTSPAPIKEVRTIEVPVPVLEKPISPADIPPVPAPLGPRPDSLSQAADTLLAKLCEFVSYAEKASPLLQLSAGLPPAARLAFPECAAD